MLAIASGPGGLVALGLVALLAVGLWRLRERLGGLQPPIPRRTVRLTAQHAVHVVELHGRRLVIGTGPGAAPALLEAGPIPAVPPVPVAEDPWTGP